MMPGESSPGPASFVKPRRFLLAFLCAALVAADIVEAARLVQGRRRAASVAVETGLAVREPAALETAALMRDDFGVAELVAEWLLGDRVRRAPGSDQADSGKARELLLAALEERPGSAHARFLLGAASPDAEIRLWEEPLRAAWTAAPGLDAAPEQLTDRYLAAWPRLSAEQKERAASVTARAFLDPTFVAARFRQAAAVMGPGPVVQILPSDPGVLRTALEVSSGDAGMTQSLKTRLLGLESAGKASRPAN